jgi:hypothetical protein
LSQTWRYDAAGNMIYNSRLCSGSADNIVYPAQGASSVRPHAPSTMCGKSFTYDANGNTLTMPTYASAGTVASSGTRSFTWDGDNNLLKIAGSKTVNFLYGPDGERLRKYQGTLAAPTSQTWYLGQDQELSIDSTTTAAGQWTKYVAGDVKIVGTDDPATTTIDEESVKFLHKDHRNRPAWAAL